MADRAFIVTSDTGTPWRIPGPRPASSTVPDWENRCSDPDCPGASAHAPDQTLKLADGDPIARLLVIPRGGGH